ncbi:AAA family ATPase [Roseibium algae]|uniref:AAA family ATPase n=1 Tax=Roseibium algae TaxID=3123038 RepID=A0ABU8THJ5_9HYPH
MSETKTQDAIFAFLTDLSSGLSHGAQVKRIDTHANVVFLVGEKAYKVKRAVKFPFLDYSTLEKRAEACHREITHNIQNAPQLYLAAVPITRNANGVLAFNGDGDIVEWAVEMNRFNQAFQLDRIARTAPLTRALCDDLAAMLVSAHEAAPVKPDATAQFYAELCSYVDQNDQAFSEYPALFPPTAAKHLTQQSRRWLDRIKPLIFERGALGHIRNCHGDAHLGNIVLLNNKPVLFDAIEFSDAMATTDTLYDLAFLLMDLWEQDQHPAANLVFNRYFDKAPTPIAAAKSTETEAADPEGLAALPFYLMMRAAIRAKIAASAAQTQQDEAAKSLLRKQAATYFNQAIAFLDVKAPILIAIGGLSGTGKTTLAYGLAPHLGRPPGARVLRSDVERKKRLGLAETDKAPEEAYSNTASTAVYAALDQCIQTTLASGHSAIFDAVFSKEAERQHLETIASNSEADFCGLWLEAPADVSKARVAARTEDASDATPNIVDRQQGYDIGHMNWAVIDAGQAPEDTASTARLALKESLTSEP